MKNRIIGDDHKKIPAVTEQKDISDLVQLVNASDTERWKAWRKTLPKISRILWYPRAGEDFHPFNFLCKSNIERWQKKVNKAKKGIILRKPDLFVYSCLGKELRNAAQNPNDPITVFQDEHSIIKLGERIHLKIDRNKVDYQIDDEKILHATDPFQGGFDHDCWVADVTVVSKTDNVREKSKLLYFMMENNNFLESLLLKFSPFKIEYLCAISEGCGKGGCKKSVVQTIFKDHAPQYVMEKGFKPTVALIFNDFTKDVFRNNLKKNGMKVVCSWDYYREGTVYVLEYDTLTRP